MSVNGIYHQLTAVLFLKPSTPRGTLGVRVLRAMYDPFQYAGGRPNFFTMAR